MRSSAALAALLFACACCGSSAARAQQMQTPGIPGVVRAGTPIVLIKEGFNGSEGPLPAPDGGIIFTETRAAHVLRIAADDAVATFIEHSGGANGLAFTRSGDLVATQVAPATPGISIIHPESHRRVLADNFQGKAFDRPNDLTVDRHGGVYFTDPYLPPPGSSVRPAGAQPSVYYIASDGTVSRVASDIDLPNGIILSPDEKTLYVANTYGEYVFAYAIRGAGSLGPRHEFARLAGYAKNDAGTLTSGADGLAVDGKGRLYVATALGVQVFDAHGTALGLIALAKVPQNLAFAGKDKRTLYIVGRGAAYRIAMLAQGFRGRAK